MERPKLVLPYVPRSQFRAFHGRSQRWAAIVAHRRAGKTVATLNDGIKRAITDGKPDGRYAYIAPFYSQAKAVAWDYLKRYSSPIATKFSETELSVELMNGARLRLFGADNPDALRGIYLDGVMLDEFGDMRPTVWTHVIRPLLSDRKGWATFIGTPKGKNQFWEVFDNAGRDPAWFQLELRADKTGILDAEELADARRSMSEDAYAQEFLCSFDAAIQGAVYGRQINEIIAKGRVHEFDVDRALPVHTSWDFGYGDATAIWFWQIARDEVRLIDYYEKNNEAISHYVELLKDKAYRYGEHWVPHDGNNKLQAAGGRSLVEQAYDLGVKMRVIPATTQANSIEAARMTLADCWFRESTTREGLEALKQFQFEFDEDKKTFRDKPRHDWTSHAADAFELMARVWREQKLPEKPKPPRFLNEMSFDEVMWAKDQPARKTEWV